MGLTSPGLVAALAVAASGLLAGLLWQWPKLAGRGIRMVLTRIAALGALELTVLSLMFAVVNRSADYYSSWSDLFGAETGRGAIITGQYSASQYSASQAIAPVTVTGSSAVRLPVRGSAPISRGNARAGRNKTQAGRNKTQAGRNRTQAGRNNTRASRGAVRAGRLQTVRIHGQLSGLTMPGYVYLPAGYSAAGRAALPLPVVTVISDQVGSRVSPYGAGRLAAAAAAQQAAGRLRPLIIVMLAARTGQDQGCLNVPGGAQAATFFAQDLPRAIGSAYRAASPSARRWGLLGDASGGYCALQLALTSSATFSAAALPPGTYNAPPVPNNAPPPTNNAPPGAAEFGGSRQLRTQDNLAWLIQHRPMQPVSVLFTARGRAQPLASLARPPMYATVLGPAAGQLPPGTALDWIGARLSQGMLAGG